MRSLRTGPPLVAGMLVGTVAVLAIAGPANAWDRRDGYQECNPNRHVSVSSFTGISKEFHVSHSLGNEGKMWLDAGHHSWVFVAAGGRWTIYTTGNIVSGGSGCA